MVYLACTGVILPGVQLVVNTCIMTREVQCYSIIVATHIPAHISLSPVSGLHCLPAIAVCK